MVIAILMESDLKLSDDLLEQIIDNVMASSDWKPIFSLVISLYTNYMFIVQSWSFNRHLLMLMLTRMARLVKKTGSLL